MQQHNRLKGVGLLTERADLHIVQRIRCKFEGANHTVSLQHARTAIISAYHAECRGVLDNILDDIAAESSRVQDPLSFKSSFGQLILILDAESEVVLC